MASISEQLCVVVPVGQGDTSWRTLLIDLSTLPASAEIILSAVEPEPANFAALQSDCIPQLRWVFGAIGRADQQNRAAALSQQTWLWFLHADSRVTSEVFSALEQAQHNALNYFKLRFYDGPIWMPITEFGVALRCWLFKLPFGDQGFLLTRSCFECLGGFTALPISGAGSSGGEDIALVRTARLKGAKLSLLPAKIATSARKYQMYGWLHTTWLHLRITLRLARSHLKRPNAP